jgi:hypothetical protein
MLAKMPQETDRLPSTEASPFRNKLTLLSLVIFLGIGLSAGYMMFPLLQSPKPVNVSNNTTEIVLSAPADHVNSSTGVNNATVKNKTANTTNSNTTKNAKMKLTKTNTYNPNISSYNTSNNNNSSGY